MIWTTTPWTLPGNRAIAYRRSARLCRDRGRLGARGQRRRRSARSSSSRRRSRRISPRSRSSAARSSWSRANRARRHGLPPSARTARATISTCRCCPAISSPTSTAPASSISRPAMAPTITSSASKHDIEVPADGRRRRHLLPTRAALRRQARLSARTARPATPTRAVIEALTRGGRAARARRKLVHSYPHSWRSKAPLIFRNTPQWFIAHGDERSARQGARGDRRDQVVSRRRARTASAR